MNDQSFFDLAMKVIARHATNADRANLDALLAQEPELRAEFERLEKDARVAKDVLPFITACSASRGDFPTYARERLQTAVRQTLGRPKFAAEEPRRGWRWVLGLAIATAVVLLLALPVFHVTNAPVIQLAILDTGGATRGTDTNEVAILEETWKGTSVQNFSSVRELQAWEKNWPTNDRRPAARVVYDRASGEVRVSGRSQGKVFEKTFFVWFAPTAEVGRDSQEADLATTLQRAKAFIREQTKK
jgi:anti-sigma-K factor RskA